MNGAEFPFLASFSLFQQKMEKPTKYRTSPVVIDGIEDRELIYTVFERVGTAHSSHEPSDTGV